MAKRSTPREQAEDTATATRPPRTRRAKAAADALPSETLGAAPGSEGQEPTEDDIRQRAYERYLQRGGGHGMDFQDWLEAEREVRGERK